MPGKLKADARCPVCQFPIMLLHRATDVARDQVTLEFIHEDQAIRDHTLYGTIEAMASIHERLHEEPDPTPQG